MANASLVNVRRLIELILYFSPLGNTEIPTNAIRPNFPALEVSLHFVRLRSLARNPSRNFGLSESSTPHLPTIKGEVHSTDKYARDG